MRILEYPYLLKNQSFNTPNSLNYGDIITSDEVIDRMNERLEELRGSGMHHTGYCVHRIGFYDI